jgi:hypothetical protein
VFKIIKFLDQEVGAMKILIKAKRVCMGSGCTGNCVADCRGNCGGKGDGGGCGLKLPFPR